MTFTQQMWHGTKIISTSDCGLTISKSLSYIVLHFHYIGPVELGGIHELTLVGAACQLTEEVHQIEEAGGTPANRDH